MFPCHAAFGLFFEHTKMAGKNQVFLSHQHGLAICRHRDGNKYIEKLKSSWTWSNPGRIV